MKEREEAYILVINRNEMVKVLIRDIVYVESFSRKIFVYTENGTYSEYEKLDNFAMKLPDNFYRCHKRCIINLDKVRVLGNNTVVFEDDSRIVMCKEKFQKLKQAYKGHAIRKNMIVVNEKQLQI
ncbi:MAG: LytTR family transcriptional regulator [Clostridiales bacterium]|nr:LytTR family transcriptional regulator [Clostridiales bacterium]